MTYKLVGDKVSKESVFLIRLDRNLATSACQTEWRLSPQRQYSQCSTASGDLLNPKLPAVPVRVTTLQLVGAWKGVVRNTLATTADFTQHVVWAVVGSGHWAGWI